MKVYLLLAEDPYYTEDFVYSLIREPSINIVGAAFPKGFINLKRIIKTFFIYGLIKFLEVSMYVIYHDIRGGKVKNLLKHFMISWN